ncbi:outer membrane protein [Microvirga thermotolerans]|uniref:Outer membrane beta-barrel protein n=1 Tax=Microvirga thermotolerans TaxID=2651334 RepID=A0A5P9JVA8_9HYPH|nr:outer membrane beta-barrel protein [Microvirga thermotolerans]QFU16373.1 outer membrane beta-barrel protein [Microvirga thermotolerans]
MKKILLSSVALLGFTAGAMAADLPSRAAPAPVVAAVPVFTWTGFYVGVNAGYGWNTSNKSPYFFDPVLGYSGDGGNDGGFVGGAQVGYNYQMGMFVLGLEADIQYADRSRDRGYYALGYAYDRSSDDWFGTVRARAGVAFDRALVYATGGFAYGDGNGGWTAGGGLEYAFTNNLSAKVEGLYVNLDHGHRNDGYVVGYSAGRGKDEFGVVRAGLNYRFGSY